MRLVVGALVLAASLGNGNAVSLEMSETDMLELFQSVHSMMPDARKADEALSTKLPKVVAREVDADESYFEYSDASETVFVVVERKNYADLAINVFYSVSLYETDAKFAAQLSGLTQRWLKTVEPAPFDEDGAGWNTLGWPGREGSAQVMYTVGHNEEYQVTKIWGHQLHLEEE